MSVHSSTLYWKVPTDVSYITLAKYSATVSFLLTHSVFTDYALDEAI